MKAQLPHPQHLSYKNHRRQRAIQIILPLVLAGLVLAGLTALIIVSTFRNGGDAARWAAISTIWLVIPIIIAGIIFLALLGGLVYLMAQLLGVLPAYTGLIQEYAFKARAYIKRGADMVVKPVILVEVIAARIKAFFGRK